MSSLSVPTDFERPVRRIAFVMDPLDQVQPDHDTTFALLREADRRGHLTYHVDPAGVGYADGRVELDARRVRVRDSSAELFQVEPTRRLGPDDLDAVWIRTDPPFDDDYLNVTLILDLLPPRVVVVNSPSGLRDANEKLSALHFPELGPRTLITQDLGRLTEALGAFGGRMVVKPIDGHAGVGVFLVRNDDPNQRALLKASTADGQRKVLAQEVVEEADQGDKRVLVLEGRPIGAMLRRNVSGGFAHNIAQGGSAFPAQVTEHDRRICEAIRPWLRERDLFFVGIDVLGGRLIEINVTSPTCLQEINRFDQAELESEVTDALEARIDRAARVPC